MYVKAALRMMTESLLPFDLEEYGQCFFKEMVATASIYFQADTRDIANVHNEMAAQRRIPAPADGSQYPCRSVLPLGCLERLEDFESFWYQHRLESEHAKPNVSYYAPISQNQSWEKNRPHEVIPTLTRNSMVYGEMEKRCLVPREHLGVQGMPAYMYGRRSFRNCALKWLLGSANRQHLKSLRESGDIDLCHIAGSPGVSSNQLRSIAGNMMSVQQVGTVMLWLLFTVSPKQLASETPV